MSLSIQPIRSNVLDHRPDGQTVDRQTLANAATADGGADVDQRRRHDVWLQSLAPMCGQQLPLQLNARPREDEETTLVDQLLGLIPLGEIVQHVRADQPPDVWPSKPSQLSYCLEGIA